MRKTSRNGGVRPVVEGLEGRRFLTVSLGGGVLTVTGTSGADVIEVQRRADDGEVRVQLNGNETEYPIGSVSRVVVFGLAGDDFIEYSGRDGGLKVPGALDGGDGNDSISGGPANDSISGGSGNDRIEGKNGNDDLSGGRGHDSMEGGNGNDSLYGGAGNDDLSGNRGSDLLSGGAGADDLYGGANTDAIFGGAGNDDFDDSDGSGEWEDRDSGDNRANGV